MRLARPPAPDGREGFRRVVRERADERRDVRGRQRDATVGDGERLRQHGELALGGRGGKERRRRQILSAWRPARVRSSASQRSPGGARAVERAQMVADPLQHDAALRQLSAQGRERAGLGAPDGRFDVVPAALEGRRRARAERRDGAGLGGGEPRASAAALALRRAFEVAQRMTQLAGAGGEPALDAVRGPRRRRGAG